MSRVIPSRALAPLAALSALATLGACAPALSSQASLARIADGYSASPTTRSSDIIASSEISAASGGSAYDVLMRLRPQFFTARIATFDSDEYRGRPVVYIDGMRLGGTEELRTISSTMLGEVRFLSPVVASERFGRYHPGGVIAISTRP